MTAAGRAARDSGGGSITALHAGGTALYPSATNPARVAVLFAFRCCVCEDDFVPQRPHQRACATCVPLTVPA